MINFWRVANGMWALLFAVGQDDDDPRRERVQRFRRFLKVERLKMVVGVPLAYATVWVLVINPWPGHSFSDMLTTYSALPPLGLVFGLPLIGIPVILLMSAAGYTVIGLLFAVGWIHIRFFGFPR